MTTDKRGSRRFFLQRKLGLRRYKTAMDDAPQVAAGNDQPGMRAAARRSGSGAEHRPRPGQRFADRLRIRYVPLRDSSQQFLDETSTEKLNYRAFTICSGSKT